MFTIPTGVAAGISYDTLPTILSRSGIAPQVTAAYVADRLGNPSLSHKSRS
ncbi:hypothetical protein [Nocardia abscessus]|uniref:hypothetical protein n=1 Tax=Nocardia abscessus TaxID=120957 RepID=UPI002454EB13|nr:hypothetical protein [Nocardia abscessus]